MTKMKLKRPKNVQSGLVNELFVHFQPGFFVVKSHDHQTIQNLNHSASKNIFSIRKPNWSGIWILTVFKKRLE